MAYPSEAAQQLTMLYLKNLDLSGKDVDELIKLYKETYEKIEQSLEAEGFVQ